MITVTASDGRTKTVEIEESMLSPETPARMLLLQLHQAERTAQPRAAVDIGHPHDVVHSNHAL